MSATTSKRADTKKRVYELIAASTFSGTVGYGQPPEHPENTMVLVGDVEGTVAPAAMQAGRKPRNDDFTIEVWMIAVLPDGTAIEADEAVEEIFDIVEGIFADNAKLSGAVDGLLHCYLRGPARGPNSRKLDVGWASMRSLTLAVSVRNT